MGFLASVWQYQAKGFYCISTKQGDVFRDHFFDSISDAEDFVASNKDIKELNIYFALNVFKTRRRSKETALPGRLLYADLDETKPSDCQYRPQVAWKTSEYRYACIWILNDFIKRDDFETLNKKLTYEARADKGGWDISQVLRVPGTRNFKYPACPIVKVLWQKNTSYMPEHFKMKLETYRLITGSEAKTSQDRSKVLYRIEMALFEQGLNEEEIFKVVRETPWNKFGVGSVGDTRLREDIMRVREKLGERSQNEGDYSEEEFEDARCFADIIPIKAEYLWEPYLPKNKIILLDADPAAGKTWLTIALCAALSRGAFPFTGEPKTSLILNGEDDADEGLANRLESFDADKGKIHIFDGHLLFDQQRGFDHLKWLINKYQPTLIFIDSIFAYISGKVGIDKDYSSSIQFMQKLGRLAKACHTTIVCVRHLTKSSPDKASIYKGFGSVGLAAVARSMLTVERETDVSRTRIMRHIKSSGSELGLPFRYLIQDDQFQWVGPCSATPRSVRKSTSLRLLDGDQEPRSDDDTSLKNTKFH